MDKIKLFPQMFADVAAEFADKTAIVDRDGARTTTYKELDELSGRVCTALRKAGVKKGDFVPVVLERGMEFIAAELGILKTGAAFIPLSKEYPAARIEHISKDCGASALIDDSFMQQALQESVSEGVEAEADDPAYAIYTSGSTGNPKGILHTYKSVRAATERHFEIVELLQEDVMFSTAPLSFSVMIFEIYFSLSTGLTVHILSDESRKNIIAIQTYISKYRPTIAFFGPQMLRLLSLENTSLRVVIAASERLSNMKGNSFRLLNGYGSSEIGGVILSYPVDRKYDNTPIGKPASSARVRLLDENGNDVQQGQEGELCVIVDYAPVYINLPEQTKKVIVPQPDGKTMIHTGDICRMQEDGNIIYINRKDWMVKINGQRVEPGEIERTLMAYPDIEVAAVKGFTNSNGQTYLCGYYTEKKAFEKKELLEYLNSKLPAYMVPQHLIRLDKMPLNLNGKLDRKQLRAPNPSAEKRNIIPPVNEKQENICRAFCKVLKVKEISIDDDFFEMGGDSIRVMEFLTLLPGLTADNVYKAKTPEQIALVWQESTDTAAEKAGDEVFAEQFDAQGRMRILDGMRYYKKTEEENNMPRLVLRMTEPVDKECLQYAAEKVFMRYRVCRLVVDKDDARFYLKENTRKPVVHKNDGTRYTVCTEENNGYMARIGYQDCEITLDMFHGVNDGQGGIPLLRTLLYYYCEKKYGLDDPNDLGRVMAEREEDPREYANSMLFLTQDSVVPNKKYTWGAAHCISGEQMESLIESKHYQLRVDADELESYMRKNGTSQSAIFVLFMNRAIAECDVLNGKPVIAAVAMDARRAYRAEETMQCCVGTIPVGYDDEIAQLTMPEQLDRTRQMIWDEAKTENIRAAAFGLKKFNEMLEERFQTLEEKRAFCIERNAQAGSKYTYGISYVGEIKLGEGVGKYVKDISAIICANTIPVIIEIVKYQNEYLINYCTHLKDDRYVGRLREMFVTEGIPCTCEQKANFIEALAVF